VSHLLTRKSATNCAKKDNQLNETTRNVAPEYALEEDQDLDQK